MQTNIFTLIFAVVVYTHKKTTEENLVMLSPSSYGGTVTLRCRRGYWRPEVL
jgi:hypothetical protein